MERTLLFFLIACLAGCASQPTRPAADPSIQDFAARIDALRQEAKIPGLAVAVVRDGEVVLARGFGYADLEAKVPVTADTPFNIASVTKPIAGVVALRLVELGRLDLDRPLTAYEEFAEW